MNQPAELLPQFSSIEYVVQVIIVIWIGHSGDSWARQSSRQDVLYKYNQGVDSMLSQCVALC